MNDIYMPKPTDGSSFISTQHHNTDLNSLWPVPPVNLLSHLAYSYTNTQTSQQTHACTHTHAHRYSVHSFWESRNNITSYSCCWFLFVFFFVHKCMFVLFWEINYSSGPAIQWPNTITLLNLQCHDTRNQIVSLYLFVWIERDKNTA